MKILFILFFILNCLSFAQQITLHGRVVDAENNSPLEEANITFSVNTESGTTSDKNGNFDLSTNIKNSDTLSISYIGYEKYKISFSNLLNLPKVQKKDGNIFYTFHLHKKAIPSQTVLIEATIGKKGITPLAFDQLNAKEIEKDYTVYDIPKYLSDLPSTTFYSESGNGIGYNYISIRGFDQRRISVSINGIPQNDPEDNNVYWLDFPDLLSSTELIQVQRGAGSGVFGYPAIGGSINIITSNFSDKPKLELSTAYGSYVTRKYSAS